MKNIIKILFGAFLSLFVLSACNGEANIEKTSDDPTNASNQTEQPKEEEAPETQQLKIGETVNFDGLKITLNSARVEPGGEFDEPQEEQFIVINLTAENTTQEEQTVSSLLNVELKDADGYSYTTTFLTEGVKAQFDGSIVAGDKLRGEIPFDVPISDTYELHFSNPFKSGKAIWIIPSSDLE